MAPYANAQPNVDQYRASPGCRESKVKVDSLDALTLSEYEQYVKDRRCKCLGEDCSTPVIQDGDVRTFKIYEGYDLDGNDYKTIKEVTQSTCINACKNDRRCVAFSWDKWNSYCFLKASVPAKLRVEPSSVAAVISTRQQPPVSEAAILIEAYKSAVFRDKGYSEITGRTAGQCESACTADRECEVYTYITTSRLCKLIRRPDEYFRLRDGSADSGVKRQKAP